MLQHQEAEHLWAAVILAASIVRSALSTFCHIHFSDNTSKLQICSTGNDSIVFTRSMSHRAV